jgi:hypothetical protein
MWTGPQIEAESLHKQRGTLLRPRPVRRGKRKTGVGDTVEGKEVSQEGGEGRRMPSRCYSRYPHLRTVADPGPERLFCFRVSGDGQCPESDTKWKTSSSESFQIGLLYLFDCDMLC